MPAFHQEVVGAEGNCTATLDLQSSVIKEFEYPHFTQLPCRGVSHTPEYVN